MAEAASQIPDKLYFKIGEVAKLVGVKPYVLRYWETEFSILRPGKSRSNHRLYRRRDVEMLLEIKRLLHDERYTIEGAKRRLKGPARVAAREPVRVVAQQPAQENRGQISLPLGERTYRDALSTVRKELEALHEVLERGQRARKTERPGS